MRQVVLDTETTGLEPQRGHRIIEIGCIELVNRRATGRTFQSYVDPEREIDEGAQAIHGISRADLAGQPRFAAIAGELSAFIDGAELLIHNAPFDLAFLDAEFARLEAAARLRVAERCVVVDTLVLARSQHPGQRNSLDALCKRYGVDNSRRDLHGALLDARILADVYLAMTGGQGALGLDEASRAAEQGGQVAAAALLLEVPAGLRVLQASADELAAHERMLDLVARASGGACLFRGSPGP